MTPRLQKSSWFSRAITQCVVAALLLCPFQKARAELRSCESCGSEFSVGDVPKSVLVKVKLIGAVWKAGIFNVPRGTDVLSLITSAGGLTSTASGDIVIKRRTGKEFVVLDYDIGDLVEDTDQPPPELKGEDVIYVPHNQLTVSENVMKLFYLATLVLGIVSTSILISDRIGR